MLRQATTEHRYEISFGKDRCGGKTGRAVSDVSRQVARAKPVVDEPGFFATGRDF
jgi:hypothetical protein